jgi:hypothetical protein
MSRVGFEPTIPVHERARTVHALDRVDTVIGSFFTTCTKVIIFNVLKFQKLEINI